MVIFLLMQHYCDFISKPKYRVTYRMETFSWKRLEVLRQDILAC